MIKERYEYRINKKGVECFRTDSYREAKAKLEELRAKKPHVRFEIQHRSVRLDRFGNMERDYKGRPLWSLWR